MSRRSALPGADELFRSTGNGVRPSGDATPETARALAVAPAPSPEQPRDDESHVGAEGDDLDTGLSDAAGTMRPTSRRRPRPVSDRKPTGRERHEEKITVYVSPDELMDLEHARLALRGDHGLPVDRGRVVREALAVVLADFEAKGEASILVRRLRGR